MRVMSVVLWVQHYGIAVGFGVFVLLVAACCLPSRRSEMTRHAAIPLDDEP